MVEFRKFTEPTEEQIKEYELGKVFIIRDDRSKEATSFGPNAFFKETLESSGDVGVARETTLHMIQSIAQAAYDVQYDILMDAWTERGEWKKTPTDRGKSVILNDDWVVNSEPNT